jgi:hypothetical protein
MSASERLSTANVRGEHSQDRVQPQPPDQLFRLTPAGKRFVIVTPAGPRGRIAAPKL